MRNLLVFLILFPWLVAPSSAQVTKRQAAIAHISHIANDLTLKSVSQREISVIRIPAVDKNNKPITAKYRFYIQGGLHGDEKETSKFVAWLTGRVIRGQSLLNRLPKDQVSFDFVPVANPDGIRAANRYNARNINLNRNFGHLWGVSKENPGNTKFSEPETRAIKFMLDRHKYTGAVDIHGYINWIVGPSKPKPGSARGSTKHYRRWMSILSEEMSKFDPTYKLKTASGLGDGGAFEDYAYWQVGTPAFCLEMASAFRHVYHQHGDEMLRKDMFLEYENLIFRIFERAIILKDQNIAISQN